MDDKGCPEESEEQSKQKGKAETVAFHKLFAFADGADIVLMVVGSFGGIGNGLGFPLMTLLFGEIIDTFGGNQNSPNIVEKVSQVTCWMVTGERQAARIRGLYLKSILRQDIVFFDKETNTGEVIGRISGDTVLIQDAMGEKVGKFVQLIATFIGGFAIAFAKGWLLTVVMLCMLPLLVLSGAAMAIIQGRMASRGQAAYAKAAHVLHQTIASIRTVASFTGEKQAVSNYSKFLVEAYVTGVHEGSVAGVALGTVMLLVFSGYALAVWFGAKMIMENEEKYNGGTVLNVIASFLTASMSLGEASPIMSAFAAGQAAAYKMFETIERKPVIDAYDPNGKILEDIEGEIELRDVCFSYPTRPEELIFNGFSLDIPSGTIAALVGQSGSGKSTVISLIERFYDPQAGEVLIDGINLKEFQLRWMRGKIGLVNQEPVWFASSIKDNIAYGKEGATIEEIRSACGLANATKFIDKLPQGLNTMVGEQGTQLSGGQKQRIAIARAILKDPRILLLDEATSALDAESERTVQEALDRVMVNRTTVVVAHRLSTVRNADMIVVIHRGKVVEKGTHSELLKDLEGAYSQLIRLQEVNKESEETTSYHSKSELSTEPSTQLTKKRSLRRSISRGSSLGGSSSHSFSLSNGLPTGVSVPATEDEDLLLENQAQEVSLHRLASLNKPEFPVLLIGCVAAIANGVILPIFGVLISSAVKTFYEPVNEMKKDSKFWALMFVVLGLASLLVIPARAYFFSVAGCKLIQRIRVICFEKVVSMEVGWFDEPSNSSGAISARLSEIAASVRALVGDALGLLVQNITCALAGVQQRCEMMYEEASQVAKDAVGNIRTVASFCAEDKVMDLYRMKCEDPMKTGIWQGLISGLGFGVSFFLLFCVYATSFYAGARLVASGEASFSDVFRVFFALTMAAIGVSQFSTISPDSGKAKSATAAIFSIIDKKSEIDPRNESGTTLDRVEGEIEFRHVNFKYPSRPKIQIFRDLNLVIHSGKTVALVGESGSGKSTVIALLQRFYDPNSGQITLDGVPIGELQLKWFRQQMGLVSQEPVLFNDTIRGNIAYGKGGDATEAEIIAAAELANAHVFISGLQQIVLGLTLSHISHGYDTAVGERGTQLSGGQKQRVAIARAMIKSPKILLLDEATSALDAESERVVQEALDNVMVNMTTVVVAHRLSAIKNADLIAVVKDGGIVEKGSHETLVRVKDGFYASLIQLHSNASKILVP
ncbi:unnamed protein product [Sphenostylis stenocarpa]|uniref:Uncharacterized protein n=1 Tax=Sphenostylis stenocarpa TaxID=92480 RepID=A0AA86S9X8_9FABA|nr:unnamed protein product [Sphenostylis stenocarpa]